MCVDIYIYIYHPVEAFCMDPQQRLCLEQAPLLMQYD